MGFGGTGAHYCIGANLARMTIDLIFNAIADEMPDLTPISPPERLRSGWLNGIKHWQVDYQARRSGRSRSSRVVDDRAPVVLRYLGASRSTIARPVAIAMPSSPSHSPARPMITQHTAVSVGHGDSIASTGAKKKPAPMYAADPARSEISTKRSHRGIGPLDAARSWSSSLYSLRHQPACRRPGKRRNYL